MTPVEQTAFIKYSQKKGAPYQNVRCEDSIR